MEAGLSRRLARLEERLEAVERHLGLSRDELTADARVEPQPFAEVAATEVGAEEEADVPPETVEVMPPPPLGTVPPTQVEPKPVAVVRGPPPLPGRRDNPPVEPLPAPALTPAAASPAAVLSYADRPKVRPVEQTTFERTVGLKWAGWVGAVVLVIGAGLGIKFAYDQGWFGGIPASVKLACLFAAGGALIAAGEYVYRRVNPLSAVGLFGAGVATLFLVSYAGQAYFNLYEPTSAFVLMAMATLVGAAVAMRGRLVSVAVLSLVGGNVAPFVLGGPGQIVPFLTYVLALQVVALVLAWWGREPKWWTLRGLSLATTSLWMTGAIVSGRAGSSVELMFASLYAALFHVELLLSARRGATTPAMTSSWTAFSTLVTALLAVAGAVVLWDDGAAPRTLWLATLAALTSAADFTLGRRDDRVRPLAVALRVQAAALLVAVAPAAVGGVALPVAWAVLAIAFAAVGTFTGSEVGRRFAVITWALAATHLLYWTGQHSGEQPVWLTVRGHGVPVAGGVAGLLALAGFAIARLIIARPAPGNDADGRAGARVVSGLATAVFVVAAIGSLPPLWATLALIAFAWALALAQPWAGGLDWAAAGAGVLAVAVAKWASVDTLVPRLSPGWAPGSGTPVLNGQTGVGALLAASVAGVARLRWADVQRSLRGSTAAAGWVVAAVAVLITFALSMEVDAAVARAVAGGAVLRWPAAQLEMLAFTTLWGVMLVAYRAAMHVVNRASGRTDRRNALSATLVALLAAKFVFLDTLKFRLGDGPAVAAGVVFNLQVTAAAVLLAAAVVVAWLGRSAVGGAWVRSVVPLLLLIVAWTGTMEIDRLIARHGGGAWPAGQLRQLLWTAWWALSTLAAVGTLAKWASAKPSDRDEWLPRYAPIAVLQAIKFLLIDTIGWRVLRSPAAVAPGVNAMTLAAVVVLAALAVGWRLLGDRRRASIWLRRGTFALLGVLLLLATGTLEIDRAFRTTALAAAFARPALAAGVAISIFWSTFAVAAVAAGFAWRSRGLRYVGLALFAVTLLKVVLLDLSQVGTGYRILSFLGLGLLLLGTSVLYGKLGPALLADEKPSAGPSEPDGSVG